MFDFLMFILQIVAIGLFAIGLRTLRASMRLRKLNEDPLPTCSKDCYEEQYEIDQMRKSRIRTAMLD